MPSNDDVQKQLIEESKRLLLKQIDDLKESPNESREVAFSRWICKNIIGMTSQSEINEAISIDGKSDYEVDIFHHNDEGGSDEEYVCWAQSKFSETFDRKIELGDILKFGASIDALEQNPLDANPVFGNKSREFVALGGVEAPIRKRMYYVVAGKLNDQAKKWVNSTKWKQEVIDTLKDPPIEFKVFEIDEILNTIQVSMTQAVPLIYESKPILKIDSGNNAPSLLGYVKAKDLINIVTKHDKELFELNPRQSLGMKAPTHSEMTNTLQDPILKQKFWKLNNGITAVCEKFEAAHDSDLKFLVHDFKIVNGRQTTFSLNKNISFLDDSVSVKVTIHQSNDVKERQLISRATNTQNPIKPVDLISDFPELSILVQQCKVDFNEFYFEKQTKGFEAASDLIKKRVTKRRVLEKNTISRAYFAFAIDPNEALMSDKDLFSFVNPIYYNKVFKNQNIRNLIIPHIFLELFNALHKKWNDQSKIDPTDEEILRNKAILNKTVVKYFLLNFISDTMKKLDNDKRHDVEVHIIETFRNLEKNDLIPSSLIKVAEDSFKVFMRSFDVEKNSTWPEELLERIRDPEHKSNPKEDRPHDYQIMYQLKTRGKNFLPVLLETKSKCYVTTDGEEIDLIKSSLLNLIK